MKQEVTLNFFAAAPETPEKSGPEEVTLYGTGAGLYGYLNVLAEKIGQPDFERKPFPIHQ